MSGTRRAPAGTEFRQERFSSSSSLSKGILGNLLALRCQTVRSQAHRRLIYFLHELSLRNGFEVHRTCNLFESWPWPSAVKKSESSFERLGRELSEMFPRRRSRTPADLAQLLTKICLDPACDLDTDGEPDWPDLVQCLTAYHETFTRAISQRVAQTEVTRDIFELLEYAMVQRGIVLAEGRFRSGKSFSSQAFCQMHPESTRYVQLSSSTSDIGFFRDIARSLGVASSNMRKAWELRCRIEDALRGQHLLLVIDEADYLWPQAVRPQGAPERVNFIMTSVVNNGVPVALIGSRNFSRMMANMQRRCPVWSADQFLGRIKLRKSLPDGLKKTDLTAIAHKLIPTASDSAVMLLVGHALVSEGRLGSMESAALRAIFFAKQRGASIVSFADVERAVADTGSQQSLEIAGLVVKRDRRRDPAATASRDRGGHDDAMFKQGSQGRGRSASCSAAKR